MGLENPKSEDTGENVGLGQQFTPGETETAKIAVEDFESTPRNLGKRVDILLGVSMVALSAFQLYTSWRGAFPDLIQRSIHLGFVLPAALLMYPPFRKGKNKDNVPFVDKLLMILAIIATFWVTFNWERIQLNPGVSTTVDLLLAPIMIFVILETSRRTLGPALPVLVLAMVAYALLGPYMPGDWAHRGFSPKMLLQLLYLEPDGIFGFVVGISATVIAGFLIFGVILSETGGGDTFVDLAKKLAGRSPGGPAKVSCFSSSFFGSISGSAAANVVVDGVFNIPLMKGLGYKKEFAAGVEATTSTGGQIVPPIMGAGAFIMAELLGMPFARIAISAIVPAILFYAGCFFGIHFWAQRSGMKPLPRELIPSFRRKILPQSGPFVIPVSALVYFLSIGNNPSLSAFYALILSFLAFLIFPKLNYTFGMKVKAIIRSLDHGGRMVAMVACLGACAQMVVGLIGATGLGIKLSEFALSFSGGNVFIALVITMIISIMLGMGVPTTAAYVLAASVCAPPLINLGVPPLAAHMFVFYFAILSAITPPVCPAVYIAAAMAQANWLKSALVACRLGLAGFLVPYMFYFAPAILFEGKASHIFLNSITAFFGVICLSAGVMGFFVRRLSLLERFVIVLCGILLIDPNPYTDVIVFVVLACMYANQRFGFSFISKTRRSG